MIHEEMISIFEKMPTLQEIVEAVLSGKRQFIGSSIYIHPFRVNIVGPLKEKEGFDKKLYTLRKVMEWATELGIDPHKTRLYKYSKFIEDRLELQNGVPTSRVITNSPEEEDHLLFILREIDEWLWVYSGFSISRPEGFNKTFLRALGGNELAKDDLTSTRDYLFELKIASYFAQAKCKVDLSQDSDLIVQLDNWSPIFVECKRIKSKNQIKKRLNELAKQLKKRYKSCQSGCNGIAAIDVTKLINPNLGLTFGMDDKENRDTIRSLLINLTKEYDFCEPFVDDKRLVLIWLHCMVPALSALPGEMSTRFSSIHLSMISSNSPRFKLLKSLDRIITTGDPSRFN